MGITKTAETPTAVYRGREQTFIKHVILRDYLERVAWNILSFKSDFVFVDGFSGPWKNASEDYSDTSFGIAIDRLRKVQAGFAAGGNPKSLRCIFVERGAHAFRRLNAAVDGAADLKAKALHGRFEDNIDDVQRFVGRAFSLVFVDPTGWSFDLRKIAPLLQHQPGEVLVNFMYEHFRRFIDDRRPDIRRTYALPFGDTNWRAELNQLLAAGLNQEEAVLRLFKNKLKEHCGFKYVASARVQHRLATRTHFYLVYGTRNPKGLVEFRKVEKDAMATEVLSRTTAIEGEREAKSGQPGLFSAEQLCRASPPTDPRSDEKSRARVWLMNQLHNYPVISFDNGIAGAQEDFSITLPEFKDLLMDLKREGRVEFDGMGTKRKPDYGVTVRLVDAGR